MNTNKSQVAAYISIAVIIISLFLIGTEITGHVTGIVNVTIETSASIIFETDLLDLGNGTVTPGQIAVINSETLNTSWSGIQPTGKLILENDGNINVSFTLSTNDTDQNLLGGVSPKFEVKVSNNETGSCGSMANFSGTYADITESEKIACNNLGKDDSNDSIMIDAQITISDSTTGYKAMQVIATATAI